MISFSVILDAQDDKIGISSGIVFSKYVSQHPSYSLGSIWRRSAWISVDYRNNIHRCFQVEASISYQERTPLELLPFAMSPQSGGLDATILTNWPTNPQNELFDRVDYARRFPNFKYAHLEVAPSIKFDAAISASLGFGVFGGILLNKNETLITRDDFDPEFHSLLTTQGVVDTITYTLFDFGVLPKFSLGLRIRKKLHVGIHAKYYISLRRLNDTLVRRESFQLDNMRWRAVLIGTYFTYDLQR